VEVFLIVGKDNEKYQTCSIKQRVWLPAGDMAERIIIKQPKKSTRNPVLPQKQCSPLTFSFKSFLKTTLQAFVLAVNSSLQFCVLLVYLWKFILESKPSEKTSKIIDLELQECLHATDLNFKIVFLVATFHPKHILLA